MADWLMVLGAAFTPWRLRTWKDRARERGLVPVLCDWEYYYALDEAENPVCALYDDWRDREEVTDPWMRHIVLVQAALRHPELARLRPVRKPGDPECGRCAGAGTLATSRRICDCGGTGWLPAEVEPWRGGSSESPR
jgi:hypothetical protein